MQPLPGRIPDPKGMRVFQPAPQSCLWIHKIHKQFLVVVVLFLSDILFLPPSFSSSIPFQSYFRLSLFSSSTHFMFVCARWLLTIVPPIILRSRKLSTVSTRTHFRVLSLDLCFIEKDSSVTLKSVKAPRRRKGDYILSPFTTHKEKTNPIRLSQATIPFFFCIRNIWTFRLKNGGHVCNVLGKTTTWMTRLDFTWWWSSRV